MDLTALINDCVCLKVRTAARAVTRIYDDALRSVGLRATQLAVLVGFVSAEVGRAARMREDLVRSV